VKVYCFTIAIAKVKYFELYFTGIFMGLKPLLRIFEKIFE